MNVLADIRKRFAESEAFRLGVGLIDDACIDHGLKRIDQRAYPLATAYHETAYTMEPVREGFYLGNKAEEFRRKLRYFPYYGRGFVQLTWRQNYVTFARLLNCDLVKNPDLALDPKRAAWIMAYGFKHGSFTGARLERYVNERKCDYVNARRCINGTDKAELIAGYAVAWSAFLEERPT